MTAHENRRRLGLGMAIAVLIVLIGSAVSSPAMAADNSRSAEAKAAVAKKQASARSQQNTKPSSDELTKPQPPSNADFSDHGANVHGPYDSTRDGSPSLNGNGTGEAHGKPCAGCVGKADNKNPHGQLPNGLQDGNAGYECDSNHGVGRSNPAHTGCPPSDGNGNGGNGNGEGNGNGNGNGEGNGEGNGDDDNGDDGAVAPPSDQPRVLPTALPKTGATVWLLVVGAGLLLAGTVLTAASRGWQLRRQ